MCYSSTKNTTVLTCSYPDSTNVFVTFQNELSVPCPNLTYIHSL